MDKDAFPTWYHGSPFHLRTLAAGSTITMRRELARVFSHKPKIVSMSDSGTIHHDGVTNGYLYVVDEMVAPDDVRPHPR